MKTMGLIITLLDDCIFSERNATEGAHRALDYIPGSALLGAVAARLYQELGNQRAFDWFHSGKMRFGNAYPLTKEGHQTFPMPACWHQAKGEKAIQDNKADPTKIYRLDKCEGNKLPGEKTRQPQQLRSGYISLNGSIVHPEKSFRMKTAINSETGRAKDAALFGYDALQAGQYFYAQIHCDNDFTETELHKLKSVFEKSIFLGRSRSAEYGRVKIDIIDSENSVSQENQGLEITLWLLSDLMAIDQYGQPNLAPNAEDLGLPKGKLIAEKSFLRTRSYSTWNVCKKSYEMERQVISKGSVLVYELTSPLTTEHLQHIAAGLGLERQAGLGQIWLNPSLLASVQPKFSSSVKPLVDKINKNEQITELSKPALALITWLDNQKNQKTSQQNFAKEAKVIAHSYKSLMEKARRLKGLDDNIHIGPSHSQWGAVLAAAKSHQALESFINSNNGSFKAQGEGWKDEFWQDNNSDLISFYDWLKGYYIKCQHQPQNSVKFFQHLVREIMAELKDQQRGLV